MIEEYLTALGERLAWRPDAELVVAEVADHLYSAADRLERAGTEQGSAQRQVLASFGDPDVLAVAFATTPRGGVAVPTRQTRAAGQVGLAVAGWWIVWGLAILGTSVATLIGGPRYGMLAGGVSWFGFLLTLLLVAPLTYGVIAGLLMRAGAGARDWWLAAALLLAALTAVFGVLAVAEIRVGPTLPWDELWLPWLLLVLPTVMAATVVWRMRRAQLPSMPSDWLLLLAWPLALGCFLAVQYLEIGPFEATTAAYLAVGAIGGALGPFLFGLGLLPRARDLARETPARPLGRTAATLP